MSEIETRMEGNKVIIIIDVDVLAKELQELARSVVFKKTLFIMLKERLLKDLAEEIAKKIEFKFTGEKIVIDMNEIKKSLKATLDLMIKEKAEAFLKETVRKVFGDYDEDYE